MDGGTCFGVLLSADITSDAVFGLFLDEISRRLETLLWGKRSISRFLNCWFVCRSEKDCVILLKLTEKFGCLLSLGVSLTRQKDEVIVGVQVHLGSCNRTSVYFLDRFCARNRPGALRGSS